MAKNNNVSQSVGRKQETCNQDELYSFLGDRVGGFHSSVVRRGSKGSVGRF